MGNFTYASRTRLDDSRSYMSRERLDNQAQIVGEPGLVRPPNWGQ